MSSQATSPKPDVRFASRGSSHFDVLLALFVVVLVVSNIAATKSIEFGSGSWSIGSLQLWPVVTDGGAFLFPLAYIVGDVISEVYGFKAARRAVSSSPSARSVASASRNAAASPFAPCCKRPSSTRAWAIRKAPAKRFVSLGFSGVPTPDLGGHPRPEHCRLGDISAGIGDTQDVPPYH